MEEEKCSVCGQPATRYIGESNVLPICDLPSCFEARIEEVNKLIQQLNNKEVEERNEQSS